MKVAHLFLITLIISSFFISDASLVGKLFGRRKKHAHALSQDVIDAKNSAYQAWIDAQKGLSDVSSAAWDQMYDAYEAAWIKYQEARLKAVETTHKSIEGAVTDYEKAKSDLKDAQNKVAEYLERFKNKAEDMTTDTFFAGLDAVETAAHDTRTKFHQARDKLASFYDAGYEEIVEDYNTAAQYLNDAAERVKNFAQYKTHKNYEKTKTKLEKAKDKAKETYQAAKSKYTEFKDKLDLFNQEITDYVKEWVDSAKNRASWAGNWMKSFKNDAKAKASENYHQVLSKIQNLEIKATQGLTEAEDAVKWATDRTSQFAADVFASIKAKYFNLKDEL